MQVLTKYMTSGLDMKLHVIIRIHTAKVDTRKTSVQTRGETMTHVANTCLGLKLS